MRCAASFAGMLKMANISFFLVIFFGKIKSQIYLCNVFFIVLN